MSSLPDQRQLIDLVDRLSGIMERWQRMLSLGGMEKRDEILLKDTARNWMLATSPAQVQHRVPGSIPISIVDRAMDLGSGRLTPGECCNLGKVVAAAYRLAHDGVNPPKHDQFVDGRVVQVCSYTTDDLSIVDEAIRGYLANRT